MTSGVTQPQRTLWRGGDLEIDFERHALRRNGSVQPLNERQWHALLLLFQRRKASQATVNKEELRRLLQCDNDDAVRQHIKKLRQALGDYSFVRTEHGLGYRLCLPDTNEQLGFRPTDRSESEGVGLVLHYAAGLADLSPMENHGQMHGDVRPGRYGRMPTLSFDGTCYIVVPDSPSLRLRTFTLCAWIDPALKGRPQKVLEKGSCSSYWLSIDLEAYAHVGFCDTNAMVLEATSETPIPFGEWTFLAGIYDSRLLHIYINGAHVIGVCRGDGDRPIVSLGDDPLIIGWRRPGVEVERLNGKLADIRIYERPLSSVEVAELYKAGHERFSERT